jgi:hypothetical protein
MGQRFLSYKGILQCQSPLGRLRLEGSTQDWGGMQGSTGRERRKRWLGGDRNDRGEPLSELDSGAVIAVVVSHEVETACICRAYAWSI